MYLSNLPAVAVGLFFIVYLRKQWLELNLESHIFKATLWTVLTEQPQQVIEEVGVVWPASQLLWRLWNWSFRSYVVHQDHYDAMQAYFKKRAFDENLTFDDFAKEVIEKEAKRVKKGLDTEGSVVHSPLP